MALLSGLELLDELRAERIVIDPSPRLEDVPGSISFDVHLSQAFWVPSLPVAARTVVDFSMDPYAYMTSEKQDEVTIGPGEFILGETVERVTIPLHLCGWLEGKSGVARRGLGIHVNAPKIDPGWGLNKPKPITLEIFNYGRYTFRVQAGRPIGQLMFLRLGMQAPAPYAGLHQQRGS